MRAVVEQPAELEAVRGGTNVFNIQGAVRRGNKDPQAGESGKRGEGQANTVELRACSPTINCIKGGEQIMQHPKYRLNLSI
jgi:hypothetical protein